MGPAPSISAASRRLSGTPKKKLLMMMTLNTLMQLGSTRAQGVLSSFRLFSSTKEGMVPALKYMVNRIRKLMILLPFSSG